MKKLQYIYQLSTIMFFSVLLQSCGVAPVFSTFENASTLGNGAVETAGSYSSYSVSGDGENVHTNNNIGLKVGYGVKDNMDLKIRYERLSTDGSGLFDDQGVSYVSLHQKWSLVENKFSIGLKEAIYFRLNKDSPTTSDYSIGPQFSYSYFFNEQFDVSGGLAYDYFIDSGGHGLAMQLGLGLMTPDMRWSIRPELAYMKNLELFSDGTYIHFGIGIGHVIR